MKGKMMSYHHADPARRPSVLHGELEVAGAHILAQDRAGDTDRNRAVSHLSECHRLGYITADVFHARMNAVVEAATKPQILALIRDLPALPHVRTKTSIRDALAAASAQTRRRAWHLAGVAAAVTWTAVGATAASKSGPWSAILVAVFLTTGLAGLVANLFFWVAWEDEEQA